MNEKYKSMSMVEVAVELQKGAKETTFIELFNKVCKEMGLSEEEGKARIAQFYTDITASGDFIYCGDDKWDLKKNQKLEALDSEFYNEHLSDESEEEEEESPRQRQRRRAKTNKTIIQTEEGYQEVDNTEEVESEDQAYESVGEDLEDSDEYDTYEKDFDSELDEEDDYDDEDDDDEDKYNDIMDDYEDLYDN